MEDVLQAFKDYCSPQKNVVFERVQYWSHQMTAGTSVNRFITELQQKSKDCEFGIIEDDMLRDKLVFSITDSHLKKRLLQERRLTFYRAKEICRAAEQENTSLQAIKTEHGVHEVPVVAEIKMILPDKSFHHNTSRKLGSQSVPNIDQTEKLVMAAFMPKVQLHRLQLQQPSVTDCVFSEKKNEEQLLPERLHIKEKSEMLSEGQEANQLCVQQETNSATCPVKCEDEEEKPQASQLHWRQLTEINMKDEPSNCILNELLTRQSVRINSKEPEAAQNPDPSSLVLQGSDGTETDSCQTEDSIYYEDSNEDCWPKPFSESEADSSKNPEMGSKASKTQMSSFQQISSKKFQVKMTTDCVGGKNASLSAASKLTIHTGEKTFKCDVCWKFFNVQSKLKRHKIIHTGEKPFECDVCRKCFNVQSSLKRHMRIHSGEKPFECDVCRKSFNDQSNLKSHMRIHSGEKPFECDVCRKCFTEVSTLKRHMKIHTEKKPFECDVCRKCFKQKSKLKVHKRLHTQEKNFQM
ncbi:zinc finger protein 23-like [Gouania willdenowi]|uniref:Zinc finger protein 23-like n=1 Tax=Gouania willdenowi TaxID=441366 RepID=A0A8C5NEA8_GOUWI|nr:zinc finger protein 23-like [Gouania willdenowi]